MEIPKPTDKELQEFLLGLYAEKQVSESVRKEFKANLEIRKNRMRLLSPELFAQFLSEKGVPQNCQVCGTGKMSVTEGKVVRRDLLPDNYQSLPENEKLDAYQSAIKEFVVWITLGDEDSSDIVHRSYYPTHCQNCGNLNLYRTNTVLKWLEKQIEQDDAHE